MRELGHEWSPQGEGNVVSLEFNLLYRWHATSSVADTEWLEGLFGKLLGTQDFDKVCAVVVDGDRADAAQLTVQDFRAALYKYVVHAPGDVKSWTFNECVRPLDDDVLR